MDKQEAGKTNRLLDIYTQMMNGKTVNKAETAREYGVNEKTIQRDLEKIRTFLDSQTVEEGITNSLIYDHKEKGYRLEETNRMKFSNEEILAITKILLDSRAFTKTEMMSMLDKLLDCAVPRKNQKMINDLIANEKYHYIELQHKKVFLDKLWLIGQAIRESKVIKVRYTKLKHKETVERRLEPLAIMFSDYYFYLVAFIEGIDRDKAFQNADDPFPTIYRIDRMEEVEILKEHYKIPYADRFEEGEFRKRVQFMYGGKLQKVKFLCSEQALEAALDRLPTAKILSEKEGKYLIQAEVFGNGIDMWLRSQGENISKVTTS